LNIGDAISSDDDEDEVVVDDDEADEDDGVGIVSVLSFLTWLIKSSLSEFSVLGIALLGAKLDTCSLLPLLLFTKAL
jgi:hypothetical protein